MPDNDLPDNDLPDNDMPDSVMNRGQAETLGAARLLLVGGGKMGSALLDGWLQSGVTAGQVMVQEPAPSDFLQSLSAQGLALNPTQAALSDQPPDIVVLAVKPQLADKVLPPLAASLPENALCISLMAGLPTHRLADFLPMHKAIIRTMPNTPAAIQQGMTALFAAPAVSPEQKQQAAALMAAVGATIWLDDENLMDAVTAISGSGPAYIFYMAEAMVNCGETLGLPSETARQLALQTLIGAAAMLDAPEADPKALRHDVTSPGGTTEAALDVLTGDGNGGGLQNLMRHATQAAVERARQLARPAEDS